METFSKAERLSGKVTIEKVFTTGKSFYSQPFKAYWLSVSLDDVPVKLLISVPKRSFKRAVDRNRIKRLIREAYRKNKSIVIDNVSERTILLMFIYIEKTILPYITIEEKMIKVLQETVKRIAPEE